MSRPAAQRPTYDRRNVLAMMGSGTLAAVVAAVASSPSPAWANPRFTDNPFSLGVASGEPLPDGVLLWTRLAPNPLEPDGRGGMPDKNVPVNWQIAEDPSFKRVVRAGAERATPELGHSIHAEVNGLRPGRQYWYRFRVGQEISPVGRTKTAPAPGQALASTTFAFGSCQNYPAGFFTAHRHLAQEDLDLVIHLGDYIYEGGGNGHIGRAHVPDAEIYSLADYRVRYGQYKQDPDLQAAHAAFPWLVTLDDHEVENNWAGSISQPDNEADQQKAVFLQRRADAFQAFYENQPLRLVSRPNGPDMQLYRRLALGDLAEINMVDTRQYRDDQITNEADRANPERSMLGAGQEQWLLNGMANSTATWNIMGNQVFVMQADHTAGPEERLARDTWDGYAAARQRLFNGVRDRDVDNFVILTGDAHRSVAANMKINFDDLSSPTIGTEFLGTSLSSGGDGAPMDELGKIWLQENPHMKFHNAQRGYVRCHVTPTTWRTDYRVVPYVTRTGAPIQTAASVYVEAGAPGIAQVE
ncbi:alkaline phosphatase D family protein [Arthrobacter castelli]|uniref:alkaline phosphatase D family protein n=1 Tax=Arthrobacter castelli TaxID=271431 RepID=UPI0003FBC9D1|nr:alkaline phosphatase D family protein [Arthrobacter castelli]